MVATGGHEKKLRIFDMSRNGSQSSSSSSSPTSPNGSTLAPQPASYELGPGVHNGPIKSIIWGPDTNLIVTAADDKVVRWWDLRSRSTVAVYNLDGSLGSCELNTVSSGKSYTKPIISITAGKTAYFFDGLSPGQLIKSIKTPHEIASAAINMDQRKVVVGGGGDNTWVRVYHFDEERELEVHKGHHGPVWSTNFSPDGKLYATGSEDGTIKLWKFCKDAYGLWR